MSLIKSKVLLNPNSNFVLLSIRKNFHKERKKKLSKSTVFDKLTLIESVDINLHSFTLIS